MKRFLLSGIALFLLSNSVFGAIARTGTPTADVDSVGTGRSTITMSYVVPSGTTILLCGLVNTPVESWTSVVFNTSESFTKLFQETSDTTGDQGLTVWALVSPTATTANVVATSGSGLQENYSGLFCASYNGTVTDSVAAATNVGTPEEDDLAVDATSTLASEGTSGNALILFGAMVGDDANPAANDASYTEAHDAGTGGGLGNAEDASYYMAEKLSGLPSGVTITWNRTDEKVAVQIELVADSGSSIAPLAARYYQQVNQ